MSFFSFIKSVVVARYHKHDPKKIILTALQRGERLSSRDANIIGHTVDSRKYISRLRREGWNIKDEWRTVDGIRFKVYYL